MSSNHVKRSIARANNRKQTPARERRNHRRVALKRHVQFMCGGRVHSDTLADVSQGGARLAGNARVPLNSSLKLFLPLPVPGRNRSRMFVVQGKVVWRSATGLGVAFTDLADDVRDELAMHTARA